MPPSPRARPALLDSPMAGASPVRSDGVENEDSQGAQSSMDIVRAMLRASTAEGLLDMDDASETYSTIELSSRATRSYSQSSLPGPQVDPVEAAVDEAVTENRSSAREDGLRDQLLHSIDTQATERPPNFHPGLGPVPMSMSDDIEDSWFSDEPDLSELPRQPQQRRRSREPEVSDTEAGTSVQSDASSLEGELALSESRSGSSPRDEDYEVDSNDDEDIISPQIGRAFKRRAKDAKAAAVKSPTTKIAPAKVAEKRARPGTGNNRSPPNKSQKAKVTAKGTAASTVKSAAKRTKVTPKSTAKVTPSSTAKKGAPIAKPNDGAPWEPMNVSPLETATSNGGATVPKQALSQGTRKQKPRVAKKPFNLQNGELEDNHHAVRSPESGHKKFLMPNNARGGGTLGTETKPKPSAQPASNKLPTGRDPDLYDIHSSSDDSKPKESKGKAAIRPSASSKSVLNAQGPSKRKQGEAVKHSLPTPQSSVKHAANPGGVSTSGTMDPGDDSAAGEPPAKRTKAAAKAAQNSHNGLNDKGASSVKAEAVAHSDAVAGQVGGDVRSTKQKDVTDLNPTKKRVSPTNGSSSRRRNPRSGTRPVISEGGSRPRIVHWDRNGPESPEQPPQQAAREEQPVIQRPRKVQLTWLIQKALETDVLQKAPKSQTPQKVHGRTAGKSMATVEDLNESSDNVDAVIESVIVTDGEVSRDTPTLQKTQGAVRTQKPYARTSLGATGGSLQTDTKSGLDHWSPENLEDSTSRKREMPADENDGPSKKTKQTSNTPARVLVADDAGTPQFKRHAFWSPMRHAEIEKIISNNDRSPLAEASKEITHENRDSMLADQPKLPTGNGMAANPIKGRRTGRAVAFAPQTSVGEQNLVEGDIPKRQPLRDHGERAVSNLRLVTVPRQQPISSPPMTQKVSQNLPHQKAKVDIMGSSMSDVGNQLRGLERWGYDGDHDISISGMRNRVTQAAGVPERTMHPRSLAFADKIAEEEKQRARQKAQNESEQMRHGNPVNMQSAGSHLHGRKPEIWGPKGGDDAIGMESNHRGSKLGKWHDGVDSIHTTLAQSLHEITTAVLRQLGSKETAMDSIVDEYHRNGKKVVTNLLQRQRQEEDQFRRDFHQNCDNLSKIYGDAAETTKSVGDQMAETIEWVKQRQLERQIREAKAAETMNWFSKRLDEAVRLA